MNIFILDEDPKICAKYHCDKHVVKMPTETAQMISFVYHEREFWNKPIPEFIMKFSKTHYKHPCSVWIRESLQNFLFSTQLGIELYQEYQYRYNNPEKHQRAKNIFEFSLQNPPNLPDIGLTPFAKAMETVYSESAVISYREYYRLDKAHLHRWTNRPTPPFILT